MEENERLGKSGIFAEEGDIVEVVKGRKYPIGMRMVVDSFVTRNYRTHHAFCGYRAKEVEGDRKYIVFGGEGQIEEIDADNVVVIATPHNQYIYYNNVAELQVLFDATEVGSF